MIWVKFKDSDFQTGINTSAIIHSKFLSLWPAVLSVNSALLWWYYVAVVIQHVLDRLCKLSSYQCTDLDVRLSLDGLVCVCWGHGVHLFYSSSTLERLTVRSYSTAVPVSSHTLGKEGCDGLWHSEKCMCLFPGWPFPSVQPEAGSGEPGVPDDPPSSTLCLSPPL